MCGIAAYKGPNRAEEHVLKALKQLEYRGYDSWGLASLKVDSIEILKETGQIGKVQFEKRDAYSHIAIGHTRWATHGDVTQENAHPFKSYDGKIALVHNGIIENATEMRGFLAQRGIHCKTPVDSEVIPHLIAYHMNQGQSFDDASQKSFNMLEGCYAVVAIHQDFDDLVAARNGVPLIVGVNESEKEYFISSDPTAFLNQTRKAVYLKDGEYCVVHSELDIRGIRDGEPKEITIEDITWNVEDVSKGSFDHFTIKEIHEQSKVITKAAALDKGKIEAFAADVKNAQNVFIVACGTSFHAALVAEQLFTKSGVNAQTISASEFSMKLPLVDNKSLIIAISQSGETADVIDAVNLATEKGATIAAIVNAEGSSLSRKAKTTFYMHCGPEIGVVATKSFLSTLMIIFSIAGEVSGNKFYPLSAIDNVRRIINEFSDKAKELASTFKDSEHIYLIGSGLGKVAALESALKIKEISYIHAEGFGSGELKHGVIALIEKGTPVIAFSTKDDHTSLEIAASEISSRGGNVYAISELPINKAIENISILNKYNTGIFEQVVFCQILAYHLALIRKCDPDKPRNLAKSVTVR